MNEITPLELEMSHSAHPNGTNPMAEDVTTVHIFRIGDPGIDVRPKSSLPLKFRSIIKRDARALYSCPFNEGDYGIQ